MDKAQLETQSALDKFNELAINKDKIDLGSIDDKKLKLNMLIM